MGEDMPPEWMWAHEDELEQHFEEVSRRRGNEKDDDDHEEGPMMSNELAQERRG